MVGRPEHGEGARRYADAGSLWVGLLAICVLLAPGRAAGEPDAGESSSEGLREAGGAARFRTIERIPHVERGASGGPGIESRVSEEVRRAIRREQWKRALRALQGRIGEREPALRFLAGYLQFRAGRHEAAYRRLRGIRERLDVLADYASYFAARAARALDRHHDAVLRSAEVPASSRLYPDALYTVADSLVASGTSSDWRRARDVIEEYLNHFGSGRRAAKLRFALVRRDVERGRWGRAAQGFLELLRNHPLSPETERAKKLVDRNRENFSKSTRKDLEKQPVEIRAAYYRTLFERHRSRRVVEELPDELSAWTPGSRGRCRALYWIGKSHNKLRQHERALEWYGRIREDCEGVSPYEKKALYLQGESYWNVGRLDRALEVFERLYEEFPEHSYADDALYFSARIRREQGREERAAELLVRQVENYPDGDMLGEAHWLRVRAWFEEDRHRKIADYIEGLERTGESGPELRGRLRYFEGRARELLGEKKAAREAYRSVLEAYPLDYYALLAANRLARLEDSLPSGEDLCGDDPASFCQMLPVGAEESGGGIGSPGDALRGEPRFQKGRMLFSIGLREFAGREFRRLVEGYDGRPRSLGRLARLLHASEFHSRASRIIERVGGWRSRYPGRGNRVHWRIAYPRAHDSLVERWADRHELSRSLVYAVARKESRFDARAHSWANARGLMQLIWPTAREVAETEGVEELEKSDLLEAPLNVRLGTAYLEALSEEFDGRQLLMAAGYNAGGEAVSEWLEERSDEPIDLWVEDIPYGQTRAYAKVVAANYWAYEWLDGDRRVPRLDFEVSRP